MHTLEHMKAMAQKKKEKYPDQSGSANGNSKLTEEEVTRIISLLPDYSNGEIPRFFDCKITESTVSLIRLGKSWKNVSRG